MTSYTATPVSIDDAGPFDALVENETRWNGFARAWFTREVMRDMAQQIASLVRDPDIDSWIKVLPDGFVEYSDGSAYPLESREIDGVPYYTLCWCWMEEN